MVTLSKSKILKIMNDTEILQISDRRKVSLIEIVHNLAKKNRKIPESGQTSGVNLDRLNKVII